MNNLMLKEIVVQIPLKSFGKGNTRGCPAHRIGELQSHPRLDLLRVFWCQIDLNDLQAISDWLTTANPNVQRCADWISTQRLSLPNIRCKGMRNSLMMMLLSIPIIPLQSQCQAVQVENSKWNLLNKEGRVTSPKAVRLHFGEANLGFFFVCPSLPYDI